MYLTNITNKSIRLQMNSSNKLLILAEICHQELKSLKENQDAKVGNYILESSKDPLEEDLSQLPLIEIHKFQKYETEQIKIINTGIISNLNKCKCILPEEVSIEKEIITISDKEEHEDHLRPTSTRSRQRYTIKKPKEPHMSINRLVSYTEKSRHATELNANTFAFGPITVEVLESEFVKQGKNIWKVLRRKGNLLIKIQHNPSIYNKSIFIRSTLIRKNHMLRNFPINEICPDHRLESRPDLWGHMMQAINHTESYIYDNTNARSSILFKVDNNFQSVIGLRFFCNSSCNITENDYLIPKNRQTILLVITLETSGLIIGRSTVEITTQNKFQNQRTIN